MKNRRSVESLDFELPVFLAIAALLLNVASLIFAVAVHRPVFGDGVNHLFELLEYAETNGGGTGRFLGSILQLPALLLRLLDVNMSLIIRAHEVGVSIHPLLSLVICYLILKKRGRIALLIFPVLSFAIGSQMSLGMAYDSVHIVHSLFWPTFLYVSTPKQLTPQILKRAFIPLILMSLSHEAAVFCYAVFAVYFFRRSQRLFATISILGGTWCLVKPLLLNIWVPMEFFKPHLSLKDPFPIVAVSSLALIAITVSLPKRTHRLKTFLEYLVPVLPLAFLLSFSGATIYDAIKVRGLTLPLASALGLACLFWPTRFNQKFVVYTAASLLLVGAVRDFRISRHTAKGWAFLKNELQAKPGCSVMPIEVFVQNLQRFGMRAWSVPFVSLFIQGTKNPKSIIFSESENKTPNVKQCERLREFKSIDFENLPPKRLTGKYFEVDQI